MKVYEVDGVEYFCEKAWRFIGNDLEEIDADSITEAEMLSTIALIQDFDRLNREADEA